MVTSRPGAGMMNLPTSLTTARRLHVGSVTSANMQVEGADNK